MLGLSTREVPPDRRRRLPADRVGRAILIPREAIEHFLRNGADHD